MENQNQNPQLQQLKQQEKKKRSAASGIIFAIFFILIVIMIAVNGSDDSSSSPTKTPEQLQAEVVSNAYEIIEKNDAGKYKYFNVYLKDNLLAVEVSDKIIADNKEGATKIFIRYFDDPSIAGSYFDMQPKFQEKAIGHYTYNVFWDTKAGGHLDKNTDGAGKWGTIKQY